MGTEATGALKLANSYVDEVIKLIPNPFEIEPESMNEIITTLDLAAKQLDKAERLDPAVTVMHEIEAGATELDIKTTRSSILLYRGLAVGFGKGEKTAGAKLIEQAIALAPTGFANAHFALAVLYSDSGRKSEGMQHLRKAIELDPENIEFQKVLDRLENESGLKLRIAAFKGSWKVFLALCALAFVGLMLMFGKDAGAGFGNLILWGGIAAGYWWWKSR